MIFMKLQKKTNSLQCHFIKFYFLFVTFLLEEACYLLIARLYELLVTRLETMK